MGAANSIMSLPYSRKLTLQEINAKIDFFALILEALILGDVNFGDLNLYFSVNDNVNNT